MNITKYHIDIYMPKTALELSFAALLRYTWHARQASKDDRYGQIDLPAVFDTRNASLIEAKYKGKQLWRTLWRQPYRDGLDLNMVLEPDTGKVITVWLNRSDDQHSTLREEEYAKV